MRIVVYPGTFDPIHRGHIDIAERASKLFDQIIFAVAINSEKNPLFNSDERIELILGATKHIPNVKAYGWFNCRFCSRSQCSCSYTWIKACIGF